MIIDEGVVDPNKIAVMFLSHFIDASEDELNEMEITVALSGLLDQIVKEAVGLVNKDQSKVVLH
tara:strand:+ start:151 stop:342 length:192 start_codon:yes stop_codon:yes gene_type:complete